jgi:DNA-binding transcriptional LysR family regulator
MMTLSGLESFVRSAQAGSFSGGARRLGLTPAAVSKNVAKLEEDLGVRLFHRSTRKLTLTESGEVFFREVGDGLAAIQGAAANVTSSSEPAGTLKVSMAPGFGHQFLLPALGAFVQRYPKVHGDWQFEMRSVDLIGEGFDAAIGGGFDLAPGLIARELTKIHIIAVASPAYVKENAAIKSPEDLAAHDGIITRAGSSNRVTQFMLRDRGNKQQPATLRTRIVVSDLDAAVICATHGLGVALVPVGVVIDKLESGALVRVLPSWYAEFGTVSLYYASSKNLPGKTRAFVDFLLDYWKREKLSERFLAR